MKFSEYLAEGRKKENKPVFHETDGRTAFPKDTLTSIQKQINKNCKNLDQEWENAVQCVNAAFNELNVPIPKANLTDRWNQYRQLIGYAVKNLFDSRGANGGWATSI